MTTVSGGSQAGPTSDRPPWPSCADQAFEECYREHSPSVQRLAQHLCGSRLAPDVTQEVFLLLWRHPTKFDPTKGSMRSLLLTVTRHKAIDLMRSDGARALRERRSAAPETSLADVEGSVVAREEAARIAQAIDALPARQRAAVRTVFYDDCSYRAAAVVLRQPEGTTKSQVRAALGTLRSPSSGLSERSPR